MAALIQFVDSISASPTVRLDLNDGLSWFCQLFKAPPPRLRRSESENSMRDGGVVGSSSYGNRTLELELTLIEDASEEWAAEEMQKLWRELDRPANFIRYWPEGLDKPVFFRTFRSDVSELEELWTVPIARNISLEILAEPFAIGLKETLGPFTVSNDPLAATNPCYVDLPTVLGDVATPVVYWDSASVLHPNRLVAVSHTTSPPPATWVEAEACTAGTDTTNTGGAADSAMTGAGATNFQRTSFATTPSMTQRLLYSPTTPPTGQWRVHAFVRRSGSSSTLRVRMKYGPNLASSGEIKTIPSAATGVRLLVDLGVAPLTTSDGSRVGYSTVPAGLRSFIGFSAERVGGTDTLDWDGFLLTPAGGQAGEISDSSTLIASFSTAYGVVDGVHQSLTAMYTFGDPTTGAAGLYVGGSSGAGGLPTVSPGAANRIYVVSWPASGASPKTATVTLSIAYWPQYLYVRPVSS